MPTSRAIFLSKPANGEKVLPETFAYMTARAKRRAYNLVIREFKKSGISKAELARRLGKGADRVSRMLGGPGNWTIATVAELLFAICGAEPKWDLDFPLDKAKRNDTRPEWLNSPDTALMKVVKAPREANTAPSTSVLGNRKETQKPPQANAFDYASQLSR
jgi:hypothetical protein